MSRYPANSRHERKTDRREFLRHNALPFTLIALGMAGVAVAVSLGMLIASGSNLMTWYLLGLFYTFVLGSVIMMIDGARNAHVRDSATRP